MSWQAEMQILGRIKNEVHQNSGLALYEVVNCASYTPAVALGVENEIGSLEEGKRAGMIIVDDTFSVEKTILGGEIRYKGE